MKKYLYLCLIALACAAGFVSCGDDDDDITIEDLENSKFTNQNINLKDNGNTLILSYTAKIKGVPISAVGTYFFDGTSEEAKCTKATMVNTFPSEAIAKQAYDEEDAEDKAKGIITLNGSQVIHDETEAYKGMTKSEVKKALDLVITWVMTEGNLQIKKELPKTEKVTIPVQES